MCSQEKEWKHISGGIFFPIKYRNVLCLKGRETLFEYISLFLPKLRGHDRSFFFFFFDNCLFKSQVKKKYFDGKSLVKFSINHLYICWRIEKKNKKK